MARLEADAQRICARFELQYRVLEAERANVKRRYGVCFSDGTIRIRLRHVTSGKPLKYSSLVNTLCHELAHLRHFNHGPRFQTFYAQILEWARGEKIYQPGRPTGSLTGSSRGTIEIRGLPVGRVPSARAESPRTSPRWTPQTRSNPTPRAAAGEGASARQLELFG